MCVRGMYCIKAWSPRACTCDFSWWITSSWFTECGGVEGGWGRGVRVPRPCGVVLLDLWLYPEERCRPSFGDDILTSSLSRRIMVVLLAFRKLSRRYFKVSTSASNWKGGKIIYQVTHISNKRSANKLALYPASYLLNTYSKYLIVSFWAAESENQVSETWIYVLEFFLRVNHCNVVVIRKSRLSISWPSTN